MPPKRSRRVSRSCTLRKERGSRSVRSALSVRRPEDHSPAAESSATSASALNGLPVAPQRGVAGQGLEASHHPLQPAHSFTPHRGSRPRGRRRPVRTPTAWPGRWRSPAPPSPPPPPTRSVRAPPAARGGRGAARWRRVSVTGPSRSASDQLPPTPPARWSSMAASERGASPCRQIQAGSHFPSAQLPAEHQHPVRRTQRAKADPAVRQGVRGHGGDRSGRRSRRPRAGPRRRSPPAAR